MKLGTSWDMALVIKKQRLPVVVVLLYYLEKDLPAYITTTHHSNVTWYSTWYLGTREKFGQTDLWHVSLPASRRAHALRTLGLSHTVP